MGIIGFILLIIALAYLIYDDRKQFADFRKIKKLMRKSQKGSPERILAENTKSLGKSLECRS